MNARLFSFLAIASAATLFPAAAGAANASWAADPVHSSASFTATHLMISHVNGIIPIKSASLEIPDGSNIPSAVKAVLDPSGVDTRNGMRDNDLRSEHFLEVATYPTMTFESTKITKTDDKHFTIDGNLTMHGQTHPVSLKAEFLAKGPGMRGEPHIAYTAAGSIDRTEWGMTYGTFIASKEIDLTIDIEAVKQ
jgi:polyisoprenoid-binding protein YceI